MKLLPPHEPLLELQREVNRQLSQSASVSFYCVQCEDATIETGIVYQAGPRRGSVRTSRVLSVHDAPAIVEAVRDWMKRPIGSEWTIDPDQTSYPELLK